MKKVTITLSNPKTNFKPFGTQNNRFIQNQCAKCGKILNPGDTAYRTARKYLCLTCGEKSEI